MALPSWWGGSERGSLVPVEAVLYRLLRAPSALHRATLRLTLVVPLVAGAVLAVAMGAQRTESAPDRYEASAGVGADGTITQQGGPPRSKDVAGLPGVASVRSMTFVFGALAPPGTSEWLDAVVFAGTGSATGRSSSRAAAPRAGADDETLVNRTFADEYDVVGGRPPRPRHPHPGAGGQRTASTATA